MNRVFFLVLFIVLSNFANVQAKTLTIASEEYWPPYCSIDTVTGKSQGFASKIVFNVMKNMEVNFKITPYPWKKAEKLVLGDKVGALYPASRKSRREVKCYYPKASLFDSEYFFYVKKSNEGNLQYNNLSDLKKYKIGITKGYSYNSEFMEFIKKNKNFESARSDELNIKKLVKGRFEYFPGEAGSVALLVKKLGFEGKIVRLPKPFIQKPYFIIFNRKKVEEDFVVKFSNVLQEYKGTEEFKSIYTEYFGN